MTDILGGLPLRAFGRLRLLWRKRQANAYRRNAIAELEALGDRFLQDIGVNRRSIPELVNAQLQAEANAKAAAEGAEPRRGFGTRPCAQPC